MAAIGRIKYLQIQEKTMNSQSGEAVLLLVEDDSATKFQKYPGRKFDYSGLRGSRGIGVVT